MLYFGMLVFLGKKLCYFAISQSMILQWNAILQSVSFAISWWFTVIWSNTPQNQMYTKIPILDW